MVRFFFQGQLLALAGLFFKAALESVLRGARQYSLAGREVSGFQAFIPIAETSGVLSSFLDRLSPKPGFVRAKLVN